LGPAGRRDSVVDCGDGGLPFMHRQGTARGADRQHRLLIVRNGGGSGQQVSIEQPGFRPFQRLPRFSRAPNRGSPPGPWTGTGTQMVDRPKALAARARLAP
jgi:hypothetical protein